MKARYPMEAFALAMIVFSQNMKDALVTGILILFITTLGLVLDKLIGRSLPKWSRYTCTIILMVSLTYSLFQIVLIKVLGYKIENTYILHIFLGILIAKNILDSDGDTDYNRFLLEGAGAFASLLIISIIREFMAEGAIFGNELVKFKYLSNGFSQVVMGFILTGIALGILNRIFYKDEMIDKIRSDSLFVIIPVVLVIQPFTIDSVSPIVSTVITIIIVLLLVYSVRRHLVFSRLSKEFKHMPVELLSTGMIYIILAMF